LVPASRRLYELALTAVFLAGSVWAQSAASFPPLSEAQAPPALVRSIRMVPGPDGPAVEIITTRPMVPVITQLDEPRRLVIDLPKSLIAGHQRIAFRSEQVRSVRVDQYQTEPSTVRIVLDLAKACRYSWDAAGNRLMVRLYPPGSSAAVASANPPAAPTLVPTSGAGEQVMTQDRLAPGASVTAGSDTAVLRLERGGEVRVCPGTTVSVTSSQDGRELMLGMSTGAVETHYTLDTSANSIITPDFRILMAGPGEFHYAVSADSRGNTCVRSLPGNTASVIVSELMGSGMYQVKPEQQVMFERGTLKQISSTVPADCGCPASRVPVLRTSAAPVPQSIPPVLSGESTEAPAPPATQPAALPGQAEVAVNSPETAKLPPSRANDIHVQVDAPFVFNAKDPKPAPGPAPADVAALPPAANTQTAPLEVQVQPPPAVLPAVPAQQARATHRGFFGAIKNFFAGMFR